jgi:hypothetical protein
MNKRNCVSRSPTIKEITDLKVYSNNLSEIKKILTSNSMFLKDRVAADFSRVVATSQKIVSPS